MKVVITGASGMVGKSVLLECLDDERITEVLTIGRRKIDLEHAKLTQLKHEDFSEFESCADELRGYNACYACMGVSSAGMNEEDYTKLTYNYTLSLAKVLSRINQGMTFIYVSGQGTDSTEKGGSMWARVKGKTENDIINLGFKQAFMFRPGAIIPRKGVQASSKLYRVLINNLSWLMKLFKKVAPYSIIDSDQLGVAMINATVNGYDQHIISPRDIIKLSEQS